MFLQVPGKRVMSLLIYMVHCAIHSIMYEKFRKQYGDQTRVDACLNINSAASYAESISSIFRHSSTAHQDSSASLPRLKLFVQQQVNSNAIDFDYLK